MLLGAHQSIAGGVSLAFGRALKDRAQSFQIFTRNARGWKSKPLEDEEIAAFRSEQARTGLAVIAHASYLVNLAATDRTIRAKSVTAFADELLRCHQLGIPYLVVHPGSHRDHLAGPKRVARALADSYSRAGTVSTSVLLEVTAGQGASLGHRFEHLAAILDAADDAKRLGVCLDTCHMYAAGYDFRSEAGYEKTMGELDALVGIGRVRAFHLNDCKKELGCRVDRHADIGTGTLGLAAFRPFVRDPRFKDAVGVLETPTPGKYRTTLQKLRALAGERG